MEIDWNCKKAPVSANTTAALQDNDTLTTDQEVDEFLRWAYKKQNYTWIRLQPLGMRVVKHIINIGLFPVFMEVNEDKSSIRKIDYEFLLGIKYEIKQKKNNVYTTSFS